MNFRYILALAAGWFLAGTVVSSAPAAENPYTPIVTRNVFGLVPIPVHDPANDPPETPLPKITPNGIMKLFGKLQVLFKVAGTPAKPGQPAKDESYVLAEGERQDEIEVQKIDEATSTITFDNHGTIQSLPLVAGPANAAGPAPAVASGGVPRPFMPAVIPPPPASSGVPPPMNFGGRSGRPATPSTPQSEQLTPEAQVIMMEAQRAQWKKEGNPALPIMPPTPISDQLND